MEYIEKISGIIQNLDSLEAAVMRFVHIAMIVGAVLGLVNCFFGFRLRRLWAILFGLLLGSSIMGGLGVFFIEDKKMTIVLSVVAGIILAGLFYYIYRAALFLMCGVTTYFALMLLIGSPADYVKWICIGAGVAVGVLVLRFERSIFIWLTGLFGGFTAAKLVSMLMEKDSITIVLLGGAILSAFGILMQYLTSSGWDDDSDEEEEEEEEENYRQDKNRRKTAKKTIREKTVFQMMYDSLRGLDDDDDDTAQEEKVPQNRMGRSSFQQKERKSVPRGYHDPFDIDNINDQISKDVKRIYKEQEKR